METGSLTILGRSVVSTFNHHIMSLCYENTSSPNGNLKMECVTNQPEKMIKGTYSVEIAKRVVNENKGRCDVFIFRDPEANTVGTLSVMYKGGNDIEYRIRSIDAFIYNVLTDEKYRGRGYACEMINQLMAFLHKKSIDKAYLAVSTNNLSAIRAYEKAGFKIELESSFIRILRVNIPYKSL